MTTSIINHDAAIELLRAQCVKDMTAAAEPIIKQAVADAEKAIRAQIGVWAISMFDSTFSIDRHGRDVRIVVDLRRADQA
jgi:hypothetical protein